MVWLRPVGRAILVRGHGAGRPRRCAGLVEVFSIDEAGEPSYRLASVHRRKCTRTGASPGVRGSAPAQTCARCDPAGVARCARLRRSPKYKKKKKEGGVRGG